MGRGGMSPALYLLLSLASCSLLRGMLLQPRHVRLEAQNFHVWLRWEPDPSSPGHATYQVEWRTRTSSWIKADACRRNSSGSWGCELYFDRIHDIYWARVRAVAGGEQSEWASSSELQLYRDTIVGPPRLSWLLQDQILSINIIMPLTPYQRRTGSYKPVDQVLLKLWYWLHLYEGDLLVQQVPCKRSREQVPCTFGHLKPSTRYCVHTAAADMARERSLEATECLVTPAGPAGFPWVLVVLSAFFVLVLLSVAGFCLVQLHIFLQPSETHLPKTLALLNSELNVAIRMHPLELEEDPLALLLHTVLSSCGPPAAGQASPTVPLFLRGLVQDVTSYCANGFGPICPEGRDLSCTHSQPGCALDAQIPSQLEKDGEAGDGDDVLEQLVPVGLSRNSYIDERESQTPETWLALHLQLYSTCQCPALGAGSPLPMPTPGRSCSQEDLQESLGKARHWVPISSVKLLASEEEEEEEEEDKDEDEDEDEEEEEDGGQLLCAPLPLCDNGTEPGDSTMQKGDPEQVALSVPGSCQAPASPHKILGAAAFSGYEPRAPPGSW